MPLFLAFVAVVVLRFVPLPTRVFWLGFVLFILASCFMSSARSDTLPALEHWFFYTKEQGRHGPFPTYKSTMVGCRIVTQKACNGKWFERIEPPATPPQAERTDIYEKSLQILAGEHLTPLN